MSNLSSVAVRSRRMSITLGVSDGSRIKHAEEADRLTTPRTIKLIGSVEGQGVFDGSDDVTIYTTGTLDRDYKWIKNKPRINGVELVGDKTSEDLGVQPAGEYADTPITDPEIDDIVDLEPLDPDDQGAYPITPEDIDDVISGGGGEAEDDKAMTKDDIDEIFNN